MNNQKRNSIKYFYLVIVFIICVLQVTAQQIDTTTSDGLLVAAKDAAFKQNNYNLAKHYCSKALQQSPDYADIRIFLGRLCAWSKQYDSAKLCFNTVLNKQPGYEDASIALADVEYWNDAYPASLATIDAALVYHPYSNDLLIRKAKVLAAMGSYKTADSITTIILQKDKKNTDAITLSNRIKNNIALNKIGVTYDLVTFSNKFPSTTPWHLASLAYTRQTNAGSFIARVNYANRFNTNGTQLELEAYPHISKTFYCYVNAGYSNSTSVFPSWRGGFSLYANLPKSFELEGGWRYLYFSKPTNILTAYLGKYYKNYLFGVRTYLVPGGIGLSQSYNAFGRYYFGGADDYLELLLGTGISPDERSTNQLIASHLKTYKASAEYRHTFNTLNILSINVSILNQELQTGIKGNQFQAGVGYQRRFK